MTRIATLIPTYFPFVHLYGILENETNLKIFHRLFIYYNIVHGYLLD